MRIRYFFVFPASKEKVSILSFVQVFLTPLPSLASFPWLGGLAAGLPVFLNGGVGLENVFFPLRVFLCFVVLFWRLGGAVFWGFFFVF